jgi:hypothetical protein
VAADDGERDLLAGEAYRDGRDDATVEVLVEQCCVGCFGLQESQCPINRRRRAERMMTEILKHACEVERDQKLVLDDKYP